MSKLRFVHAAATIFLGFAFLTSAYGQNTNLGVFTQQYYNARTGNNTFEKILTPKNVNSTKFGKLFSISVDGQVYAQPLWAQNVNIPGQGVHNVVYIATEMDSVYAFDANTGAQLWRVNFTDPGNNIGPVPCQSDQGEQISCSVFPYYGVTGTPVISTSTKAMYLVARTWNSQTQTAYQMLHALDLTTGAEKFGGPVEIGGSVHGTGAGSVNGIITFDPLADIQRPGLLVENDNLSGALTVYIGFSGAAHGWMMAYDAKTLLQTAIFNTTPNAIRGGVWQSGNAMAADSNGYIYASTGDGLFDVNSGGEDYGDSLLKFDGGLNVVDYFTPLEAACRYKYDFDLSSSGPMLLPKQGGPYPDEVVESGKGGSPCDVTETAPIYLLNRDSLGKFNANGDNSIQDVSGAGAGYWSSPTYWKAGNQAAIYYAGVAVGGPKGSGDNLKMYTLTNGELSSTPVAQSANVFPIGATPSSSGNGNTNGIIWATLRQEVLGILPGQLPAILYAYDATNLNTLYASNQSAARDTGGCAVKFQVPVVANGKVYIGTQNTVDVFGILGTPSTPIASLSSPCYTFNKQAVGTTSPARFLVLTNIGTSNMTLGTIAIAGMNPSDFAQTNNCPATLAPNANCTIKVTFTPSALGPRVAQVIFSDNAPGNPHNTQVIGTGI